MTDHCIGGLSGSSIFIINEERSHDICSTLNEKYTYLLVALVAANQSSSSNNATPTQVTARKISENSLTLSFVECAGNMCSLCSVDISFNPPIKSSDDAIARLVKDGQIAMEPRCVWLVTEKLPLLILIVTATLGYVTLVLGEDGILTTIDALPLVVQQIISSLFGSYFFVAVRASFYFAIVAHTTEAVYVAVMLRTKANLSYLACFKWFVLICCVGYPLTKKAVLFFHHLKEDKLD
jgi:hypothetical protein